jgi:serine/threonine protein kinase
LIFTVDVWSIGCIFAEFLLRKPLFPGNDFLNQIKIITDIVGISQEDAVTLLQTEHGRHLLEKLGGCKPKIPLASIFPKDINPLGKKILDIAFFLKLKRKRKSVLNN